MPALPFHAPLFLTFPAVAVAVGRQPSAVADTSVLAAVSCLADPEFWAVSRSFEVAVAVLAAAGVLALLVAVVGIYSVTSYLVTLRRHEIGVRVALGANAGDVIRLVLNSGMLNAAAGVIFGSVIALVAGRFIEPLLFSVSPRDPVVFGSVALTLIAASGLACVIPAMRANRISPVDALRSD